MNLAQAQALGFATILGTAAGARRAAPPAFGAGDAPPGPIVPPPAPANATGSFLPWWGWMIAGAGALAVGYVGVRYAGKRLGSAFGAGRDQTPCAADGLAEYARDPRARGVAHVPRRPPPPLPTRRARAAEHDSDVDDGFSEMYDFNREDD